MTRLAWRGLRRAKDDAPGDLPVFCIVTPVFNGAAFIDDTIRSVLAQSGEFVLHYHVQDGGSTDDTVERVRRWMALSRKLPGASRRLVFTCACEPDGGMYDAINKGFARALPAGDDVVMGWIGADDRVAPGACATIVEVRRQFPDVRFLGGRISLMDEAGSILGVHQLVPFSQRCMAAGLYDGRALSFVMQEGTFWCADLWRKVGGLDTRFRLAGDWDLWRRFAAHEPYFSVDGLLGFHRRRAGQLSEQMDRYYAEVDDTLDREGESAPEILASENKPGPHRLRDDHVEIAAEYERIKRDPPRFRASRHAATALRYDLGARRWDRIPGFGLVPEAPQLVQPSGRADGCAVLLTDGFRAVEGPYPEHGLFTAIRWMVAPKAGGRVTVRQAGRYRVIVRCRNWIEGQRVTLTADGEPLGAMVLQAYQHDRDLDLSVAGWFQAGEHDVGIVIGDAPPLDLYLLVIDWRLEPLASEDAEAKPLSRIS